MILKFDEATHTYWINGIPVISNTQVLKEAGIIDYSHIHPKTLVIAQLFGTAVHLTCHLSDKNQLDYTKLDPKLKPYLNAYRRFLSETGFILEQSELIVGSEKYICLLYTSPSPRDATLSRMPSSA